MRAHRSAYLRRLSQFLGRLVAPGIVVATRKPRPRRLPRRLVVSLSGAASFVFRSCAGLRLCLICARKIFVTCRNGTCLLPRSPITPLWPFARSLESPRNQRLLYRQQKIKTKMSCSGRPYASMEPPVHQTALHAWMFIDLSVVGSDAPALARSKAFNGQLPDEPMGTALARDSSNRRAVEKFSTTPPTLVNLAEISIDEFSPSSRGVRKRSWKNEEKKTDTSQRARTRTRKQLSENRIERRLFSLG